MSENGEPVHPKMMGKTGNKFRGVALSYPVSPEDPSNDSQIAHAVRERDAKLVPMQMTVTKMVEQGPPGLEHIKLERIGTTIGTVIHGVDLANLSDAEAKFIRKVWLERKMVGFRNQGHLTHQQHMDFALKFGDIQGTFGEWEREPSKKNTGKTGPEESPKPEGYPQILRIEYTPEMKYVNGGDGWHSDATWTPRPPMGSILLARKVPSTCGATCFADTYAMYQGLAANTREKIQNLSAYHRGAPYAHGTFNNDAVHPVLRTHPETGGTNLFVNPVFVKHIEGLPQEESESLLGELFRQIYNPEYQCRFQWEDGSVAFWDNRGCMHYAVTDFFPYERMMQRVTIVDPNPENKAPFYRPQMSKM